MANNLHVQHPFRYISLPSLHEHHGKFPLYGVLFGGSKLTTRNFALSFQTWMHSPSIQLQEISKSWNKRENVWENANTF